LKDLYGFLVVIKLLVDLCFLIIFFKEVAGIKGEVFTLSSIF